MRHQDRELFNLRNPDVLLLDACNWRRVQKLENGTTFPEAQKGRRYRHRELFHLWTSNVLHNARNWRLHNACNWRRVQKRCQASDWSNQWHEAPACHSCPAQPHAHAIGLVFC